MGQCCKKKEDNSPFDTQALSYRNKTTLREKLPPQTHQSTSNDNQFTYFLGVFQLLSLGQLLQQPEYIDQLHPAFTYEKFNNVYHQYQQHIVLLGKYIDQHRNVLSQLHTRILKDQQKIQTIRSNTHTIGGRGCMVKIQLQQVFWKKAKEILLSISHSLGKDDRIVKIDQIERGGAFIEIIIPDIRGAALKFTAKGAKGEIVYSLEDCLDKGQQLFCKVMKWPSAGEEEGLALRIQLVTDDLEGEKFNQMVDLHSKLTRDYGVGGEIHFSFSEKQTNQRLSRHRDSLSKKYQLGKNSMF